MKKNSSRTAAATAAAVALVTAGVLVAGSPTATAAPVERVTSLEQLKASIQQAVEQESGAALGIDPTGYSNPNSAASRAAC
ncbi:hypothetical protein FKN01_24600 [Streptomyces sp. 130]|uniref:hypothetical protein n=1 Tax=Streptomyces sp. 130 TaxID=2591006 RepID=UPI0011815F5A|nr:hypothetical protein [Streptomyces sp. 130]TRV74371.1 hypothetical protein FKN01_24600 [Streptomyces sp. 130]